jgi:hypothetical protein
MAASDVRIEPVTNRRELRAFIMFPFALYRHDPLWVPPLISERLKHFDPHHNPFYQHAQVQLWRAVRGDETVGTIAAIDDQIHPQVWKESVGFFGEFEVIEDYSVAAALFDTARSWLAGRGREVMRGPMNMNINEECALLIEGFDGPPVLMMTYNPPYYQTFIERYGMVKAKDLLAFLLDAVEQGFDKAAVPPKVERVARIARERYKVQTRHLDLKHLDKELELLKPIHRSAWDKNWGALPMTDAEFDQLAANLGPLADPDFTMLAFIDDKPIGVFIGIPDYNQVAIHLNGRLFPFGWLKFLWYKRKMTGGRALIMGVLEEHRLKGVEACFFEEMIRLGVPKGFRWVELSWLLEDNYKVIRGVESMGGRLYRRYRIFDVPTKR